MTKMQKRYLFDFLISGLLIFEMLIQYTGNFLHEVIGAVFFVTICIHLLLSHKWFSATGKQMGKRSMGKMAKVKLLLVVLLFVSMIVLGISSVIISDVLYAGTGIDLAGASYGTWAIIHTISSYALCITTAIHLAIHWASALAAFEIPYNPRRREAIGTGVTAVASVGVILLGLNGFDATQRAAAAALETATNTANNSAPDASSSNSGAQNNVPQQSAPQDGMKPSKKDKPPKDGSFPNDRPEGTAPSMPNGSSSDSGANAGSTSGSSTTSGICTLCRKSCSLSNPHCNRPYEEGLI